MDALITAAIIGCLENRVKATVEELANYASNSIGKKVTTNDIKKAINRNTHRLEIKLDAGIFKVSLKIK